MHPKAKTIQVGYHFFGEGIILFLLLFPVFYYSYLTVPYWSYLAFLIVISIIFSALALYTDQFFWYILAAPVVFLLGILLFKQPLMICGMIAIILTWRYITLRKELFIEKEQLYLQWTTILVLAIVIFYQEIPAIIFLLIQFLVFILGYISVQTLGRANNQQKLSRPVAKLFLAIISAAAITIIILYFLGVPILFLIWDIVIVNAWDILTTIIIFIASIPMYFLQFLLDKLPDQTKESLHLDSGPTAGEPEDVTGDVSAIETNSPYILIAFLIILLAVIFYFALRVIKKRFVQETVMQESLVTHHFRDDKSVKPPFHKRFMNKLNRQPAHPVRKLVYQLDKRLAKENKGRLPDETIEEWFSRIDLKVDTAIYQKVRYGDENVSNDEIKNFKSALRQQDNDNQ